LRSNIEISREELNFSTYIPVVKYREYTVGSWLEDQTHEEWMPLQAKNCK